VSTHPPAPSLPQGTGVVVGLFIGQPKKYIAEDGTEWRSSIFRDRVDGPIALSLRGFEGDKVADTKHHGTPAMAVCFYPLGHYALWNAEFSSALGPGCVGENLCVSELDEASVCIGDILKIGSATIQISQPRFPCYKQERRTGIEGFLKRVFATRRTGWYARVLEPGALQAGDEPTLVERPHPDVTVARANLPLLGPKNPELARELLEVSALSDGWKYMLERKQ
jgi:MOSC domain-containing protein YiiM